MRDQIDLIVATLRAGGSPYEVCRDFAAFIALMIMLYACACGFALLEPMA